MATVSIDNLRVAPFEIAEGEKLLDALLKNGIDYMHACGGKGRCTTCKVKITWSEFPLPEYNDVEKKYSQIGRIKREERLSCQLQLFGSISITVPKESQLPHLSYTDQHV